MRDLGDYLVSGLAYSLRLARLRDEVKRRRALAKRAGKAGAAAARRGIGQLEVLQDWMFSARGKSEVIANFDASPNPMPGFDTLINLEREALAALRQRIETDELWLSVTERPGDVADPNRLRQFRDAYVSSGPTTRLSADAVVFAVEAAGSFDGLECSGSGMRRVCRKLGIRHSRKALNAFVQGKE